MVCDELAEFRKERAWSNISCWRLPLVRLMPVRLAALLLIFSQCRRILLFPHGNNTDQCSIYLEHGFDADTVPDNWSCCVQFSLVLWNPNDPSLYVNHAAHHRFTKEEGDWGFTRFVEIRRMFNVPWEGESRPLIENDAANITAYVRLVEDETGVLWHNFTNYDSKKETGYVGLKNQGATCYLNSLLQSLYFTNAFRKVGWLLSIVWKPCLLTVSRLSMKFRLKMMRACRTLPILFSASFISCKLRNKLSAPMS